MLKWFKAIILALLVFSFVPSITEADLPKPWTIVGNTVFYEDNHAYLAASPHTLGSSGWVEFTLKSKSYEGDLDAVWGFSLNATPSQLQIWNEEVEHNKQRWVDTIIDDSITLEDIYDYKAIAWDLGIYPDIGDNSSELNSKLIIVWHTEEMLPSPLVIAFNTYDQLSPTSATFYYKRTDPTLEEYVEVYPDWKIVNLDIYKDITFRYQGMSRWYYIKSATVEKNKVYKLRCWVHLPFSSFNKLEGKYLWGLKPSNESLQEAKSKGHLYLLDPWYNQQWLYRKPLYLDNDDYAVSVNNTLVVVSLNATNFNFSHAQTTGYDLLFRNRADSETLSYFRGTYNATSQEARLVVGTPQVADNGTADYIWLYYGNASAADGEDIAGIFDANVVLYTPFWSNRLNGATITSIDDYTQSCAVSGATWTNQGYSFDGNDCINCGSDASLDLTGNFTELIWANVGVTGTLMSKQVGTSYPGSGWWHRGYTTQARPSQYTTPNSYTNDTSGVGTGAFKHYGGTHNNTQIEAFMNAVSSGSPTAVPGIVTSPAQSLYIGRYSYTAGEYITGIIGEIIYINKICSLPEITHIYNTTKHIYGGDAFITFGIEEGYPLAPTNFASVFNGNNIDLSWTMGVRADNTIIVRGETRYPISLLDGLITYNGTATSYTDNGCSSETATYYYSAFSWNSEYGQNENDYATTSIGGEGVISIAVAIILLGLGAVAFWRRSPDQAALTAVLFGVNVIGWLFGTFYFINITYPSDNTYLPYAMGALGLSITLVMAVQVYMAVHKIPEKRLSYQERKAKALKQITLNAQKGRRKPWYEF